MLNFNKDHKALVLTAFGVFVVLSLGVAVFPAFQMEKYEPLPDQPKMTEQEYKGQQIFVAEGCVACHTQQVRNIEMDNMWGKRPSVPEDYVYSKKRMDIWRQSPSLLGSERTGPDLTDVGNRQSGEAWQLMHLYNPRAVVTESVMPSFPWLFEEMDKSQIDDSDVVVSLPKEFFDKPGKEVVATEDVENLVAYLISLKQPEMPENSIPKFIPFSKKKKEDKGGATASNGLDGEKLFKNTCSACHQDNGKGVPGAFPPLAGSATVNDEDPTKMIEIIIGGYDNMPEYGPMPGFGDQLSDAEIAAIMTHERSSWGNTAPEVTEEMVKKVRASVEAEPKS